jgi:RimJ/RimL family protein N-acetyltransferase
VIETARLRLRPIELGDASALAANLTPAVTRSLASWPDPMTAEIARARIERSQAAAASGRHFFRAIVLKAGGEVIGGLSGGAAQADEMEIAYHLAERAQGHGYMREAAQAALPYIWETFPVARVSAGAQLDNDASFGVMRALGMEPVGERRVFASARNAHETHRSFAVARGGG